MSNPNNCYTCGYFQKGPGDSPEQHCYMFQDEPSERCMQHTGNKTVLTQQNAYEIAVQCGFRGTYNEWLAQVNNQPSASPLAVFIRLFTH